MNGILASNRINPQKTDITLSDSTFARSCSNQSATAKHARSNGRVLAGTISHRSLNPLLNTSAVVIIAANESGIEITNAQTENDGNAPFFRANENSVASTIQIPMLKNEPSAFQI